MTAEQVEPEKVDGRRLMTDEEREKMMSTIHSMVFWVGILVPEFEMVEDHEIELRETVYRLTTKDHLSDEDRVRIDALIESLRNKERVLELRLKHDAMTVDSAKALMEEIRGLLKAIDELRYAESIEHAHVGKDEVLSRVEDARRWHRFIQDISPSRL